MDDKHFKDESVGSDSDYNPQTRQLTYDKTKARKTPLVSTPKAKTKTKTKATSAAATPKSSGSKRKADTRIAHETPVKTKKSRSRNNHDDATSAHAIPLNTPYDNFAQHSYAPVGLHGLSGVYGLDQLHGYNPGMAGYSNLQAPYGNAGYGPDSFVSPFAHQGFNNQQYTGGFEAPPHFQSMNSMAYTQERPAHGGEFVISEDVAAYSDGDDDGEYIDNQEQDDQCDDQSNAPVKTKNGTPRKKREPRAKLLKWTDHDWKMACLAIVYACGEEEVAIPFEKAARVISEHCSASALQQALLKLKGRMEAEGRAVPQIKMSWTRNSLGRNGLNTSLSRVAVPAGTCNIRAHRKKAATAAAIDQGTMTNIRTIRGLFVDTNDCALKIEEDIGTNLKEVSSERSAFEHEQPDEHNLRDASNGLSSSPPDDFTVHEDLDIKDSSSAAAHVTNSVVDAHNATPWGLSTGSLPNSPVGHITSSAAVFAQQLGTQSSGSIDTRTVFTPPSSSVFNGNAVAPGLSMGQSSTATPGSAGLAFGSFPAHGIVGTHTTSNAHSQSQLHASTPGNIPQLHAQGPQSFAGNSNFFYTHDLVQNSPGFLEHSEFDDHMQHYGGGADVGQLNDLTQYNMVPYSHDNGFPRGRYNGVGFTHNQYIGNNSQLSNANYNDVSQMQIGLQRMAFPGNAASYPMGSYVIWNGDDYTHQELDQGHDLQNQMDGTADMPSLHHRFSPKNKRDIRVYADKDNDHVLAWNMSSPTPPPYDPRANSENIDPEDNLWPLDVEERRDVSGSNGGGQAALNDGRQ